MQHPEGSDKLRRIRCSHLRKQGRAKNAGGWTALLKTSQFPGGQSAKNGRIRTAHYHVSTTSGHAHARDTAGPAPSPAVRKTSFLFFGHSRLLFLFSFRFRPFFCSWPHSSSPSRECRQKRRSALATGAGRTYGSSNPRPATLGSSSPKNSSGSPVLSYTGTPDRSTSCDFTPLLAPS